MLKRGRFKNQGAFRGKARARRQKVAERVGVKQMFCLVLYLSVPKASHKLLIDRSNCSTHASTKRQIRALNGTNTYSGRPNRNHRRRSPWLPPPRSRLPTEPVLLPPWTARGWLA